MKAALAFSLALATTGCFAQNLIHGEYFFDADPGFGAGDSIPAFAAADTVDLTLTLPTTGLSYGYHVVYTRFLRDDGVWSFGETRNFFLDQATSEPLFDIVAAEYFINADPGHGNGISVPPPGVPADSLDFWQDIADTITVLGEYTIGYRVKNANGIWSMPEVRDISICATYGALADFDIYRSGSSVSFVDQSQYATSILYDFGDGQTDTVWNPYHTYDGPGNYTVTQIAVNNCALDTLVRIVNLSGLRTYHPDMGANAGYCTIALEGANFSPNMTLRLFRSGSADVVPDSVYLHSPSSASCMLNLLDQDTGFWDLELVLPGDTVVTIPNGFRIIEAPQQTAIQVQISHPAQLRSNTWGSYTIDVQNPNMNDAFGVPVWIAYTSDLDIEYEIGIETPVFLGSDTLPEVLTIDSLFHRPFSGSVRALIVPHIPALSSFTLSLRVKSSLSAGTAELTAWAMPPLLGLLGDTASIGPNGELRSLSGVANCISCFIDAPLSCILGFSNLMIKPFVDQQKGQATGTLDYIQIMIETVRDCGLTALMILAPGLYIVQALAGASGVICLLENCFLPILPPPLPVPVGCACDPNEKYGQRGIAPMGYVAPDRSMSYQIAFENVDTSLFSAQRVLVIDTLDGATLNIHRTTLHSIGIGDSLFLVEPAARSLARTIPLSDGYELRLNAAIDTIAGVVRWDIFMADTIDHELPTDPLVGFLPPNLISPQGQGFVTLRIPMKEGLPHEQTIVNQATIIFDNNEPIATEPWLNTIDALPPTSNVAALPSFSPDTVVSVSWSGSDANSGVAYYEVYSSADTSAGYNLLTITGDTTTLFIGEDGLTYHFYSIAVDSVGNREVKADTSETQTQIDFSTGVDLVTGDIALRLFPNPTTGLVSLRGHTESSCTLQLEVLNAFGQVLLRESFATSPGLIRRSIDVSSLATGAYVVGVTCNDAKMVERMIRISE